MNRLPARPAADLSWSVERVSSLMGVMGQPYPYVAVSLLDSSGKAMYSERVSRDDGEHINVYENPFDLTHAAIRKAAERCINNYRGKVHVDSILSKYEEL